MSTKSRRRSNWIVNATTVGIVVALPLWTVLISNLSSTYAACITDHRGKAGYLFCSASLLAGRPLDWLVFGLQWLPFAALIAFFSRLRFAGRDDEKRRAARRIKDRARRAARKSALSSSQIQSQE